MVILNKTLEAFYMKCSCYETEANLVFCVEDFKPEYEANLQGAWFEKNEHQYLKKYNKNMEDNGVNSEHKLMVCENFKRLGPTMFQGNFNWAEVMVYMADKFDKAGIEWYVIGSVGDAMRGIEVTPNDIDIMVNSKDFFRTRDLFSEFVVEPFVDNLGAWIVRYFGRLCIGGAIVDIAADEKNNLDRCPYDIIEWGQHKIFTIPLNLRYETEVERERTDRVQAFQTFISNRSIIL